MTSSRQFKKQRSWRTWLAWYPVRVHGRFVWFKFVQRKGDFYWCDTTPKRLRWLYRHVDEGIV